MGEMIMIIDGHLVFRKVFKQIISDAPDFLLISESIFEQKALALTKKNKPDMVILDLNIDREGLETLKNYEQAGLLARYVVLVESRFEGNFAEELKSTVVSSLMKNMVTGGLSGTVLEVSDNINKLTGRENEVLDCLAEGMSNKIIAHKLCISISTVKVHIKHILKKLDLTSRIQAAVWKYQQRC